MNRFMPLSALCFAVMTSALGATTPDAQTVPATQPAKHSANTPDPRTDAGWVQRNESFNDRDKKTPVDLVFLGDSITQGWEGEGKDVWQKHYAKRNALNLGIGGDRTQHVLWRIQHGNLDGMEQRHPKLVVLMIGTNNSNGEDNTSAEIADGITAIVATLRQKLPQTKILLLGIFPRGEKPNPQREKNAKATALAGKVADGKLVHFLDIGSLFLAADGTISKDIMPDFLHLSPVGYEKWAAAIEPTVRTLMGE